MHIFKHGSKQKTTETHHMTSATTAEDAETNQVYEWQPLQVPPAPRMSQDRAWSHAETRMSEPLEEENHLQMEKGNIYPKRDFSQAP